MATEPGFECPACGNKLFGRRCPQCGWKAAPLSADGSPTLSCWTCTRCKVRSPGQPTIIGLCGSCHFEVNIRPHASRPTDVCDAVHPAGEDIVPCELVEHATRAPHHHVAQHIKDFRRAMARISERFEEIKL